MATTIKYPDPSAQPLWKTKIHKRDRLQVINEEDLPVDEFLKALGIKDSSLASSFGITNEEELHRRHNLCRFLTGHPAFTSWVEESGVTAGLPIDEEEFLKFYNPQNEHNPYWAMVHGWIEFILNSPDAPPDLQMIANKLLVGLDLEAAERKMADIITQRVEQITVMHGWMSFEVVTVGVEKSVKEKMGVDPDQSLFLVSDLEYSGGEVFGHRKYSQKISTKLAYPKWTHDALNPFNWLGFGFLRRKLVDFKNLLRCRPAYKAMVINSISTSMIEDIRSAVLGKLRKIHWDNSSLNGGQATVQFSYDQSGLQITILHLEIPEPEDRKTVNLSDGFAGYDALKYQQIMKAEVLIQRKRDEAAHAQANNALIAAAVRQNHSFLTPFFSTSLNMDREFRWFAILNEYRGKEFHDLYEALQDQRNFFAEYWNQLQVVISVLRSIQDTALKFGVPICQPEIVTDGHVVEFGQLYPTQLLCHLKKGQVVPVHSLPELNGRMIALTGEHGGGKSETQIGIVVNIFLAQSGLPVFGQFFRFNVKKVLGMVFIAQRGEGSTCEILLGKIRNILRGIQGIDGKRVVLVLDEVGTGTQEMAGFELGRDLLNTLARSGVSVIFSTQIMSLAEFARDQLNALCFQLDSKHRLSPGIGDGGMKRLRQRIGVDRFLEEIKS
ncbi:hypothetical protein H6761_03125 [Candidatus Nomurabacteria bacterium]|nr:hypothetical protein [Candidatus Nomurabacteria bacterium]